MTDLFADGFYLETGELSTYGFACGYIEKAYFPNTQIRVTMWKEHNTYHVLAFDNIKGERLFWDVFDTVGPARKRYRQALRELKKGEQ